MNNTLRPNIHVRTSRHLTVLRYTKCIKALPVIGLGVIWNDHSVGYYNSWCIWMRWKKAHWVPRVHHQSLFVCHFRQVFQSQAILHPILKNSTISTIRDEFMRMLCDAVIKVVLDHEHDRFGLFTFARILVNWSGKNRVLRHESIHVNSTEVSQFFCKFSG